MKQAKLCDTYLFLVSVSDYLDKQHSVLPSSSKDLKKKRGSHGLHTRDAPIKHPRSREINCVMVLHSMIVLFSITEQRSQRGADFSPAGFNSISSVFTRTFSTCTRRHAANLKSWSLRERERGEDRKIESMGVHVYSIVLRFEKHSLVCSRGVTNRTRSI